MNMIDALQSLKDAGLIVDFKTDDAGSEYSVVFQSSVPNLELSELFDRVIRHAGDQGSSGHFWLSACM